MTLREQTTDGSQSILVPETATVTIQTSRFGEVAVRECDTFLFPTGIPGFPQIRDMHLFPNPGGGCFEWLHAGHGIPVGFAVLAPDPALNEVVDPGAKHAARLLGWSPDDKMEVRLIVTIPSGTPEHATINLRAPVLLNRSRNVGAQPILTDETLPYRLPLFPDTPSTTDR